jgi:hypothetical protein
MSEDRIRELIEAFDCYDGKYKRAEMEEAVALREEITPPLIRILEDVAADPEAYVSEKHFACTYAVALLSYFQEPAAHLPIIRAFCIPEEQREMLWAEMVTETFPILLFQTCNGSLEAIKELILDRSVYAYTRGAAVEALTFAVARGVADREEVIGFLVGLFTGSEAARDSDFWSDVASSIADMHPEGAMDVIRQAYADCLVYDGYVGLKEIEKDLLREKDDVLAHLRDEVDTRIPTDIHEYLSWIDGFGEDERAARPANPVLKAQKNKKKDDRARNKMAKKSKKKNRK